MSTRLLASIFLVGLDTTGVQINLSWYFFWMTIQQGCVLFPHSTSIASACLFVRFDDNKCFHYHNLRKNVGVQISLKYLICLCCVLPSPHLFFSSMCLYVCSCWQMCSGFACLSINMLAGCVLHTSCGLESLGSWAEFGNPCRKNNTSGFIIP